MAQVCLASAAPSDWASFGHRSGHRSETPSLLLSFTRPKAAGEGRSMSCPMLWHHSGWGPHRFSCPPHPFGVRSVRFLETYLPPILTVAQQEFIISRKETGDDSTEFHDRNLQKKIHGTGRTRTPDILMTFDKAGIC